MSEFVFQAPIKTLLAVSCFCLSSKLKVFSIHIDFYGQIRVLKYAKSKNELTTALPSKSKENESLFGIKLKFQ